MWVCPCRRESDPGAQGRSQILNVTEGKKEKKKKVRVHFNRLNSQSQTSSPLPGRRCWWMQSHSIWIHAGSWVEGGWRGEEKKKNVRHKQRAANSLTWLSREEESVCGASWLNLRSCDDAQNTIKAWLRFSFSNQTAPKWRYNWDSRAKNTNITSRTFFSLLSLHCLFFPFFKWIIMSLDLKC